MSNKLEFMEWISTGKKDDRVFALKQQMAFGNCVQIMAKCNFRLNPSKSTTINHICGHKTTPSTTDDDDDDCDDHNEGGCVEIALKGTTTTTRGFEWI